MFSAATLFNVNFCPILAENEDGIEEKQFYVHYEEWDRRLDEWIDASKIVDGPSGELHRRRLLKRDRTSFGQPVTRSVRRMQEEFSHKQKSYEEMDATTAKLEKQHEEVRKHFIKRILFSHKNFQRTKVKNVKKVAIGHWEVDVWCVLHVGLCNKKIDAELDFILNRCACALPAPD